MPYKDPEKQREYQREWARRKRASLPTRTTPKLSEKERRQHKLECQRRYKGHRKQVIKEAFGTKCFFCNRGHQMTVHRKDGKNHKKLSDMSLKELGSLIKNEKDKYILLCYGCHKAIHWVMENFGFTWEQIISLCGK